MSNEINKVEMRSALRGAINSAADYIHDATRWDQRDEADEDGLTPMDRLVTRIETLYGELPDDCGDPVWNAAWLAKVGWSVVDYQAWIKFCGGELRLASNGVCALEVPTQMGIGLVRLPSIATRRELRRLCAALGITLTT